MQQGAWEDEMAKTNEKTLQFLQVGSQTLLKSAQTLLLPRTWRTLIGFPFRYLPAWREIEATAQKHWLQRLPAVLLSSIMIYALMSIVGIGNEELLLASLVSLAGLACFAVLGGKM
jgi:hypothetical protein